MAYKSRKAGAVTTTPKTSAEKYSKVLESVLAQMESGTVPWTNPVAAQMPHNAATGRQYQGANVLALWARAANMKYEYAGWVTFNQAKGIAEAAGNKSARILKDGQKSTFVLAWSPRKIKEKDKNGVEREREIFMPFLHSVFNVSQLSDDPVFDALRDKERGILRRTHNGNAEVDTMITGCGADIITVQDGKARYNHTSDIIMMPRPQMFANDDEYYGTMFHELAHWTGHESRLSRPLVSKGADVEGYAFEELVAELTSAFLAARYGYKFLDQSAAYLKGWMKAIKDGGPRVLMDAARFATAAANYLIKDEPAPVAAPVEPEPVAAGDFAEDDPDALIG